MPRVIIIDLDIIPDDFEKKFRPVKEACDSKDRLYVFTTRLTLFERAKERFGNFAECTFIEDFFKHDELEGIDDAATGLIKGWSDSLLKRQQEEFKFSGISLFSLWEYELTQIMPFILKKIKFIKKIFTDLQPDGLWIFASAPRLAIWKDYIRLVQEYCKINVKINGFLVKENNAVPEKEYPKGALKTYLKHILTLIFSLKSLLYILRVKDIQAHDKKIIYLQNSPVIRALFDAESRLSNFIPVFFQRQLQRGSVKKLTKKEIMLYFDIPVYLRYEKRYANINGFLQEAWKEIREGNVLKGHFKYEGIAFWPIIQDEFKKIVLHKTPERIKLMQRIFFWMTTLPPALIILEKDNTPFERTICEVAKEMRIKILVVQHGIQAERRGHDIIYADVYAVWGQAHRSRYIRWGNPSEKIVVTGNPAFDRFYREENGQDMKVKICNELNLAGGGKIVTLAVRANWPLYWFSAFRFRDSESMHLKELIKALDKLDDVNLVLKVHPGEAHDSIYYTALNSFSHRTKVVIAKNVNLDELLLASDLIVSTGSTVALEAMILKKPVIIINFTSREDLIGYAGEGCALGVYKREDLPGAIERIFNDNELKSALAGRREEFIKDYAFAIDGYSSQRVWEVIYRMINGSPSHAA